MENKCYNSLYDAVEKYVAENWESLDLRTHSVYRIVAVEVVDGRVQRVYVSDLPGMRVAFDVGFEIDLSVGEGDYHYDENDECSIWLSIPCEGDLECGLDDWEIDFDRISVYNPQKAPANSMTDALVLYISYDQLEKAAHDFLEENYPEALKITPHGEALVFVDPLKIAEKLGLTVKQRHIWDDLSVFGQLYFTDTDAELYDEEKGKNVPVRIPGKTILVEPDMFLLQNLDSVNNTIIHECVHWDKHKKVFELERLFNADASHISCEVIGGAAKSATE